MSGIRRFVLGLGAALGVVAMLWGDPATATGPVPAVSSPVAEGRHRNDVGVAERITAAARVRTLSAEIFAAACHMQTGVLPVEGYAQLRAARNEMRRLLNALEFGDPALRILGAEHRARTIADLHAVRVVWAPAKEQVNALLRTTTAPAPRRALRAFEEVLEDYSSVLASTVSGQYANPFEMLAVDALALDLAARQALQTQRIAALACAIGAGEGTETAQAGLQVALDRLDLGFDALLSGMPAIGLPPAPTPSIAAALEVVRLDVQRLRAGLDRIGTGDATPKERAKVARGLAAAARSLEGIVLRYAEQSKRMY